MELREVLGRRRSIRYLLPHRPVEPEKIQMMFEAARIASHWGNVQSLRGIAVFRDSAPQEVLDAVTAPLTGYQIKLAPVTIIWYLDTAAVDEQSDRVRELGRIGALGYGDDRVKAVEEKLVPIFDLILDSLKEPGIGEVDCGQGIAQATLMAFDLGLGTCFLGTPHGEQIRESLGMPETCRVLLHPDRRLPGREPRGWWTAPPPALRGPLPHQRLRQPVPALAGGGRRADPRQDVPGARAAAVARRGARVPAQRPRPRG